MNLLKTIFGIAQPSPAQQQPMPGSIEALKAAINEAWEAHMAAHAVTDATREKWWELKAELQRRELEVLASENVAAANGPRLSGKIVLDNQFVRVEA